MTTQHFKYRPFKKILLPVFLLMCSLALATTVYSETVYEADLSEYYSLYEDSISHGYYGLRIRGSRSTSPSVQLEYSSEECENIAITFEYTTRGLDTGEQIQIYFSPAGSDFGLVKNISEGSGTFTHKPQNSWGMHYKIYNGASSFFERVDIRSLVIRGDDAESCRDGDCNCTIGKIDR